MVNFIGSSISEVKSTASYSGEDLDIRDQTRDKDPTFFFSIDPAQLKKNPDLAPTPDPTFNRNKKKIYLYFR